MRLALLGLLTTLPCMLAQSVPFGPVADGVYLLAATPTPKTYAAFGADLYKFDSAGKLVFVREIAKSNGVTPKSARLGVQFVLADYDSRILVIGSPVVSPKQLDVVLMDAPSAVVQKQLQVPDVSTAPWIPLPPSPLSLAARSTDPIVNIPMLQNAWMSDNNGVPSLMLHWMSYWRSQTRQLYKTVPISAMGLGGEQFVPQSDHAYRRASGAFGLAGLGDSNFISPGVVKGRLQSYGYDLGLPAPAGIADRSRQHLFIYNKQMAVLYDDATSPAAEESVLQVWTPLSGKWTSLRVPGQFPHVKGIDTWILGAASSLAKGRVSPGQAERKKRAKDQKEGKSKSQKARPDTDQRFNDFGRYYPGTLFAIDTTNGKMITWQTGQGDSEILLIRGDTFIYRVNDSLYSARIQGTTIGSPQLLAQDEAVPDMHWAFSSRQ